TSNTAWGFFAFGSILGPALMALLLSYWFCWTWLYVFAGLICVGLIAAASCIRYPQAPARQAQWGAGLRHTFELLRDPLLLGFSALIMLYVAVEVAIYVWMPSYLRAYRGSFPWLPLYGLTLFFVLRALGRFAAVWLLG